MLLVIIFKENLMDQSFKQSLDNINRRKLLARTAAVAATVAAGSAFAGEHKHHHHASTANTDLISSALDCVKTGEACDAHCIKLVKHGDDSIAECLDIVNQMLPVCSTLSTLASAESNHLVAYAEVCIAVLKDCEKECEVHADMHAECKACMEACAACIKECNKLTA